MFFISGEVNGEVFDNKKVTTTHLMKLFGVEDAFGFVNQNSEDAMVEFEYHSSVTKMKGGVLRHPNRYRVPAEMRATYNGRTITIKYATSERWDKNGNHETVPTKLNFGGKSKRHFSWMRDMELIMFFYLHPSNNSSPLRNKRTKQKIVWDLVNHQDRAVSSIQSYTDDMRVRKEILEDDIKVLARKARGLGLSIPSDSEINENKIRNMLMNSYELHVKRGKRAAFIQKFNSAQVGIAGTIQGLVDKGYILQKKRATGQTFWVWREGLNVSGTICVCERGVIPMEHLQRTIIANFDYWDIKIREILEGDSIASNKNIQRFNDDMTAKDRSNAPKTVNEMSHTEVVMQLKMHDLVGFNKETKSVHFFNSKKYGEFLKDPLLKVNTPKDWVAETAVAMESEVDLKVALREKLDNYKNK